MTGRYPRPGWAHRRPMILRDAATVAAAAAVIVLTAAHLYQAVALVLIAALLVAIAALYLSRPTRDHVDAWRRNHANRWGDRW